MKLKRTNDFGYFDTEDGVFVLREEPPKKWVNLHYNQVGEHELFSEITNIGDGRMVARDGAGCTCTLVNYDSKYLFVRDEQSGVVFSPWGEPAPQSVTGRECRYYPAKTEISGECDSISVKQRVFVLPEDTAESWTVTLENRSDKDRELSVFAYAMFQLTGCDSEGRPVGKENLSEVHPDIGGVYVYNRRPHLPNDRYKGYLITLNKEFYNANGYRDHFTRSDFSIATPRILWGWNCDGRNGYGPDCAGVVQVKVKLPAGTSRRVDFLIGQTDGLESVQSLHDSLSPEAIDAFCEEQVEREKVRAEAFTVDTGHRNIDGLVNFFVKKQLTCYNIIKSGFRDNLQNDCGIALFDTEMAKQNLLQALASQYANGSVPHGFRPLNRVQYSDKPAWIFMTISAWIQESGDFTILDEFVPYFESEKSGTVMDHMVRAMRFMADDVGPNGLSDQHHADWNDGLESSPETGERESVMVSMQFCYGMYELAELARRVGQVAVAEEAEHNYQCFKQRINESAWDGEWYVRTICEDGYRIGSKENFEGKIFMNTQSWAVLSGVADKERSQRCMAAVDEWIETPIGYRICAPGFSQYDPRVGRMSEAIPDHIENGGCYNHAAGFKAVADCMMGRAEEAWRTLLKVAPDAQNNPLGQSQTEPFSFTNSYSMATVIYGKSGYPWRTGTANWMTMLLVEWILGARRHYDGLLIDPCLSASIPKAKLRRRFRGTAFEIEIDNSSGTCVGVRAVYVDGKEIEGNLLTCMDGGCHHVLAVV